MALTRRLNNDTYAAYALAAATVIALIWANIGTSYETVWATEAGVHAGRLVHRVADATPRRLAGHTFPSARRGDLGRSARVGRARHVGGRPALGSRVDVLA
ncbi:hypothetical protein C5E46_30480 [Nocardia nova]|nr:hypothetical protein C5E46_30480 [Nocardia nova]